MNRDAFEAEVVALAKDGGRVTVANVAARTGLSLRTCQTLLEMMARDGGLDRGGPGDPGDGESDDDALVVYRVRGLDRAGAREPARVQERGGDRARPSGERPRGKVVEATREEPREALRGLHDEVIAAAGSIVVKQAGERIQAAMGVEPTSKRHLGAAALAGLLLGPLGLFYAAPWMVSIVATAAYLALRWLPFWPTDGMWKFWLVVHLGFALASFLYAVRFNRAGERAPLLPARAKKRVAPPSTPRAD
jgi:hypothetical protein